MSGHGRLTVALVGADGAGKSTLSGMLRSASLPRPVKTIYMGVNLEASSLMLPTTRALLTVKRARGGAPDLVASRLSAPDPEAAPKQGWRRTLKDSARLAVWALEEWLRQLVAAFYTARGYIVVFDRHFYADYYHADVVRAAGPRSWPARLHGWMLQHLYPKPDLVVCLDAPAEVLFARKPEASVGWLDQRRRQYLALESVVPAFAVVDATRPLDAVLADVTDLISTAWKAAAQ
jgi:thymidylate kinase